MGEHVLDSSGFGKGKVVPVLN